MVDRAEKYTRLKKSLDMLALAGMGIGIVLIMQPWWHGGFRSGFFTTLGFTVMHVFTSHTSRKGEDNVQR